MAIAITSEPPIGWIGTGVMGVSMCANLMKRGHPVTLFNRTKSKAQPLLDKGAKWVDSPKAVAEASDVIFTIVGFPEDVRKSILAKRVFLPVRSRAQ